MASYHASPPVPCMNFHFDYFCKEMSVGRSRAHPRIQTYTHGDFFSTEISLHGRILYDKYLKKQQKKQQTYMLLAGGHSL